MGGAALVGWGIAKTRGLWFVDGLDVKEPIQLADGLSALLAGVAMVASAAALLIRRHALPGIAVATLAFAALLSASPGSVRALDHTHAHVSTEPAARRPAPRVRPQRTH